MSAITHEYTVIIEQDAEGFYVAEVPELQGCYTQAKSLDELMERVCEVIALCAAEKTQPLTAPQIEELERRIADDDAYPDEVIPWETIRSEAHARLKK